MPIRTAHPLLATARSQIVPAGLNGISCLVLSLLTSFTGDLLMALLDLLFRDPTSPRGIRFLGSQRLVRKVAMFSVFAAIVLGKVAAHWLLRESFGLVVVRGLLRE